MPRKLALALVAFGAALVVVLPASTAARPYVQIVSETRMVPKGEQATLVAKVEPSNAKCDLVIYLRSGRSYARGLGPKRAVKGRVAWTWTVSRNSTGGTFPIYVECGSTGIAKTWFRIV